MTNKLSTYIATILFVICMSCVAFCDQPELPNIVLINIDDMGYADISPFGNTQLRTPHLQKLAEDGRRCEASFLVMTRGQVNPDTTRKGTTTNEMKVPRHCNDKKLLPVP